MLPGVSDGTAPPTAATAAPRRRAQANVPLRSGTGLLAVLTLLAVFPGAVARADPEQCRLGRSLQAPGRGHLFGYDLQGCDYLAQTVYGTRTSLGLALLVIAGTTLVAVVVGALAGYAGGRTDALLSRVTDVWTGVPLVLGGVLVLSGRAQRGVPVVAAVLIVFGWPPMARVLRASVLEVRERDHVTAARALGASPLRILRRHVLPHAVRPLLVFSSAYAGVVIAAEATLTFAGVGLQRPTQSWGIQLFQAQDDLARAPHLLVFPGLFMVTTVAALVLVGEGLRQQR